MTHVLATAGHVDHGKSTLVRALTGTEPDRWAEERRRGMTIDLGYAWTTLPDGAEVAFVDVPGHERFIANMLAGLGPAPAVLFVVAADEGWSRQSEEHLAAVSALDLRHGLLVVTRADLADPGPALAQSLDRVRGSSLGAVDAVAVSAVTGQGLDELRAALTRVTAALPRPDASAPVRLWIDRAFTIRGAGTVATGTLSAGSIAVGDHLRLGERDVVVRGLQSLDRPRDRVAATARVAVNLRGVPAGDVHRGDVLLTPDRWHRTALTDVRVDTEAVLPAGLVLHVGTASGPVHVRPLGPGVVRLTTRAPLPLRAGDRGVLRDPTRRAVAAGFLVLDADPPPLHRRGAARLRGDALRDGPPSAPEEVARRGAVRRAQLAALGIDPAAAAAGARTVEDWLIAATTWQRWVDAAPRVVAAWARSHPLDPGMPLGALHRALDLPAANLLGAVLAAAALPVADGRARTTGATRPTLGAAEAGLREVEQRLRRDPFLAPERNDLAGLGLGRRELAAAEQAGRLLRLGDDLVLLPDAPDRALAALAALPQPFTTSQARAALGSTRRVVIPLLEYLDRTGRTRRVDDLTRRVV